MKNAILIILLFAVSKFAVAQQILSLETQEPNGEYENIHVSNLDHDPLTSTFLIWVKHGVKEHYHEAHTEVVCVLQGEGWMTLGEERQKIKSGDYVFIPKGTRHSVEVIGDIPMKVISIQTPHFDGLDRVFVDQ